ncbi:hypothetical protein E2C01_016616 [Portunus trituberculatus]|uniref:Uncharacterized protein n=1 Tax=Portunus trituberculatus TaxID=210409 RepID=A0A5B7DPW2_PORTR|nr:hypothetical protein [Portunus trituberculatus]
MSKHPEGRGEGDPPTFLSSSLPAPRPSSPYLLPSPFLAWHARSAQETSLPRIPHGQSSRLSIICTLFPATNSITVSQPEGTLTPTITQSGHGYPEQFPRSNTLGISRQHNTTQHLQRPHHLLASSS